MKVLRVISSMKPEQGGPCQGIRNSIPPMQALGVITEVVCMDDPDSAYLLENKDPFAIIAVGNSKGPWHYNPALYEWLVNNIKKYDAVIVHGLWLYHGYAVNKAIKALSKKGSVPKWFVMPHGMLDPYFQKAGTRRLKAMRNWLYWKLIEGKIVNHADGVLFTCQEELRLARKTFTPYEPKKELNVGYGVVAPPAHTKEMDNVFFAKYPFLENKNYMLFLSRIHEKKGVDMLINAYIDLSKHTILKPLVIAGPGMDTPYGISLQETVNKARLKDKIIFPGMLSGDFKWAALYNAHVFILPSHQENFGIAVAEALACKIPVLISDKVNIWQEIISGGGGMVNTDTEQGTLELLTNWIALGEDFQSQMGEHAFNVYLNNYSGPEAAKSFYKNIKSV